MYQLLHDKFIKNISISEEDFEFCKTIFIPKKLRKKQFLLQEGDVAKYTALVNKGIT